MAAIGEEEYKWQPTVVYSGSAKQNAKINVWDADSAVVVNNLSTDVNGQIAVQNLQRAIHSITLVDTVATDLKTPHDIRALLFTDTALETGKYASRIFTFQKTLAAGTTIVLADTFPLTVDNFVTHTKTAVDAYTGIAFNHTTDTITITVNHTLLEIYEAVVAEAYDNPQQSPVEILLTTDGVNFDCLYNVTIDNCTVTADGQWLKLPAHTFTLQNGGQFSGKVTDLSGTQVTHVLTGIEQNSEVTYVDDADNPTITYHHIENVDVSGQSVYAYTHTVDFDVDILIFHVNYEPIQIEGVTLTDQGGSIPIDQRSDAVYQNP